MAVAVVSAQTSFVNLLKPTRVNFSNISSQRKKTLYITFLRIPLVSFPLKSQSLSLLVSLNTLVFYVMGGRGRLLYIFN